MKQILTAILLLIVSVAYAGNYTYQQDGGVIFAWETSDVFALYSASGSIMELTVKSVESNESHYAIVEQVGWAFATNAKFYGCYPYNVNYLLYKYPYTALPITYTNQTQTANNNTEHLAQTDYMTAQGSSTQNAFPMNYTRFGSILRIAAYVPEEKTFTSLTLTARDNTQWFTTEATMNATNNTMAPTATAASATLSLNNITVAAGDSLIAYIMTAPADLSGKSMQLSLQASDGSALQTYLSGCNIQAGKAYPLSVGRENYFRTSQSSAPPEDEDTEEILSLQLDIENSKPTDAQITTTTAYAPDFAPDASNKMKAFLLGDVNLDGVVDVTDAVLIINHYQARTTEQLDFNVSDVNGDSVIDVTDAVGIINIYQNRMQ